MISREGTPLATSAMVNCKWQFQGPDSVEHCQMDVLELAGPEEEDDGPVPMLQRNFSAAAQRLAESGAWSEFEESRKVLRSAQRDTWQEEAVEGGGGPQPPGLGSAPDCTDTGDGPRPIVPVAEPFADPCTARAQGSGTDPCAPAEPPAPVARSVPGCQQTRAEGEGTMSETKAANLLEGVSSPSAPQLEELLHPGGSSASLDQHRFGPEGHLWRKYAHKRLVHDRLRRHYYACVERETNACQAKKVVNRLVGLPPWDISSDQVSLEGEHNHPARRVPPHLEPQAAGTTSKPSDLVTQPLPSDLVSQPLPSDLVSQPLPSDLVSQPLPSDLVSQPLPSDLVSQPLPSDLVSQPLAATSVFVAGSTSGPGTAPTGTQSQVDCADCDPTTPAFMAAAGVVEPQQAGDIPCLATSHTLWNWEGEMCELALEETPAASFKSSLQSAGCQDHLQHPHHLEAVNAAAAAASMQGHLGKTNGLPTLPESFVEQTEEVSMPETVQVRGNPKTGSLLLAAAAKAAPEALQKFLSEGGSLGQMPQPLRDALSLQLLEQAQHDLLLILDLHTSCATGASAVSLLAARALAALDPANPGKPQGKPEAPVPRHPPLQPQGLEFPSFTDTELMSAKPSGREELEHRIAGQEVTVPRGQQGLVEHPAWRLQELGENSPGSQTDMWAEGSSSMGREQVIKRD